MTTTSQVAASDLQGEYRANPGAHLPMILVCAVIALLCVAGVVWGYQPQHLDAGDLLEDFLHVAPGDLMLLPAIEIR